MTLKTFAIQTKAGRDYIAKLDVDNDYYGIILSKKDESDPKLKEVMEQFSPSTKFITLRNAYIMLPTQAAGGKVQTIPIRFSEIPTGSDALSIAIDNISEINLIPDDAEFVKALRLQESNLVIAGASGDVEKSSRLIHKFGR